MSTKASKSAASGSISIEVYESELFRMQAEFVKVQEWARVEGQRIMVVFEGRDAAGK
ncbi:MAG: polyphosphate kinase 2, partial [Aeromicrobium sp.]